MGSWWRWFKAWLGRRRNGGRWVQLGAPRICPAWRLRGGLASEGDDEDRSL
jgi:hypothetical protein